MNHPQTELIVALDFARGDNALKLVEQLQGTPVLYKVGFELFMNGGPEFVRELVHRKNRVFLDLKLYDIPNTVAKAVKQASLLHVEMLTVHIAGGSAMIRAISEELKEIPTLRPKILGVSVLTSFDDVRWAEITRALTGHAADLGDSVNGLVDGAVGWGVDGVVCSALEVAALRSRYPSLYLVVPGIRLEGMKTDDQARVATPSKARDMGASAIVVGRPITESRDPRQTVETILEDLSSYALSIKKSP